MGIYKADKQTALNARDQYAASGKDIEGGTSSVQTEFNKLLNSNYYKKNFGYDCSEIAQDFYDAAGQNGKIYFRVLRETNLDGFDVFEIKE